jgi:hypothetical protein
MKKLIGFILLSIFISSPIELFAQTGFKMELVSVKLTNKVSNASVDWKTPDSTKITGLIIKVNFHKSPSMDSLKTGFLIFESFSKGELIKSPCLGMTVMSTETETGFWIMNDELEKGIYYTITPSVENKNEFVDFLFPIPTDIQKGNLKYNKKTLIENIVLK